MTMPVVFRTDASSDLGMGHFSRCMSLAHAVMNLGASPCFIMRAPGTALRERLETAGIGCHEIEEDVEPGSEDDARATLAFLKEMAEPCLLLVDHYAISRSWELLVRPWVQKIAIIDDLADRAHDCDLLVDQNRLFDGVEAYAELVPPSAQLLVGPRYALLRQEFAEWRSVPRRRNGKLRRLLVAFGGSDPAGHTLAVLRALEPRLNDLDCVDVLVGPLNGKIDELIRFQAGRGAVRLHVDATNIAELLHGADLAIGGGGTMSWERLCLGVPSLVFGIVPNQVDNVRDLVRSGVAVGTPAMFEPDIAAISRWLDVLWEAPELVRGMSERGAGIVDGLGAARVASRLLCRELTFRPAVAADSMLVHGWRNHPEIREVSGNKAPITLEEHERWFARSLADASRMIMIAELGGLPVGVVRFDLAGSEATISIFKNPEEARSFDLVGQATDWLFGHRSDISTIRAVVLAHNRRSARAFERAGYRLQESVYIAERIREGNRGKPDDRI